MAKAKRKFRVVTKSGLKILHFNHNGENNMIQDF